MITLAARYSNLSQKQVEEIIRLIQTIDLSCKFKVILVKTTGDLDQNTSLRSLDKTDFFTKQIDQMILEKKCQVAIHSAKDLPYPIPRGLKIAAITKGIDPRDSLVMQENNNFFTLPSNAKIATSSIRREEMIKKYRKDLEFVDLRGTIEKRLEILMQNKVNGVVIAEAALIRLKLTHLNRFIFNEPTVELQGKLAVIVRDEDDQMFNLFREIDGR